jgi:hypothetical protein
MSCAEFEIAITFGDRTFSPSAVLRHEFEQMSCVELLDAESFTNKAIQDIHNLF